MFGPQQGHAHHLDSQNSHRPITPCPEALSIHAAYLGVSGDDPGRREINSVRRVLVALHERIQVAGGPGVLSPSGIVGKIILLVSIASLAKTWNALMLMASRIVLAQARAGMLPAAFTRLNQRAGAPSNAILLVTCISIAGMLLGKGALIPIMNMATICIALIMVLTLVVLLKLRRRQPKSPGYAVPGAMPAIVLCCAGALLMAGFAFFAPLLQNPGHVPLEWMLMAVWAALGLAFSRLAARG